MITIIAAVSDNNVIGRNGSIPWHLPNDLARFKEITKGSAVIMGRITFQSILTVLGKTLPDRRSVVVSRTIHDTGHNNEVADSLEEALEKTQHEKEQFIIGGERLYREALPRADRIYLTRVHTSCEGDAFFPEINMAEWNVVSEEKHEADNTHAYKYTFLTYERKK